MREEIWTEKIFKDDAGYFLRLTKKGGAAKHCTSQNKNTFQ